MLLRNLQNISQLYIKCIENALFTHNNDSNNIIITVIIVTVIIVAIIIITVIIIAVIVIAVTDDNDSLKIKKKLSFK